MKLTPHAIAILALLLGAVLAVSGVYHLAGTGWALIAAAVPSLLFGAVILRGLSRGQ